MSQNRRNYNNSPRSNNSNNNSPRNNSYQGSNNNSNSGSPNRNNSFNNRSPRNSNSNSPRSNSSNSSSPRGGFNSNANQSRNDEPVNVITNLMKLVFINGEPEIYVYSINLSPELAPDNLSLVYKIYRYLEREFINHFKKSISEASIYSEFI